MKLFLIIVAFAVTYRFTEWIDEGNAYLFYCGSICLSYAFIVAYDLRKARLFNIPKGHKLLFEYDANHQKLTISRPKTQFDIYFPPAVFIIFLLITIYKVYTGDFQL